LEFNVTSKLFRRKFLLRAGNQFFDAAKNRFQHVMKVLIAGGAGFIGSTVASACIDAGMTPIILDNLVTGRREFTTGRLFYEGDIADGELLTRIYREHPDVYAVVHCAALIVIPDSVFDPLTYYRANVVTTLAFLTHLLEQGCERLIFSSTAAIYQSSNSPVKETSPIAPGSPYAHTKAHCEDLFADVATVEPINVLSLRYFNPIGADPRMRSGPQLSEPTHALGRMIRSTEKGEPFYLTGASYPTKDGSAVRDYLHVWDLARAHVLAIEHFDELFSSSKSYEIINLGRGEGATVKELLKMYNEIAKTTLDYVERPARAGDVAGAVTSNEKAARLLGWQPQLSVEEAVNDSLRWASARVGVLGF
jgi:UDP-glucose 4-epimerase